MKKLGIHRSYLYILFWFVLTSTVCLGLKIKQYDNRIDFDVIEVANVLLFILSMISCAWHLRSVRSPSQGAFMRGLMGSMMMKLLVLVTATFIYLYMVGTRRNAPAIFISMGLYVVYAVLDVRSAYKLLKKPNEKKD